jgi:hypothetical protein
MRDGNQKPNTVDGRKAKADPRTQANDCRVEHDEESAFPPQLLARLWPNRVHESNWLKSLACSLGLHRWYDVKFEDAKSTRRARFCRWCSELKVL